MITENINKKTLPVNDLSENSEILDSDITIERCPDDEENPYTIVRKDSIRPLGFNHSFDVGIARECGLEAACIYNHLCYWLKHNSIKGINFHEGRYWTYDTHEKMSEYMPYLNARQIKYALQKLVDSKLIIKGNFNRDKFDKTSWYALYDQSVLGNSKNVYEETKLSHRQTKDKNVEKNHQNETQNCRSMRQNCLIEETNLSPLHNTYTIHTNTNNTSLKVPANQEAKASMEAKASGDEVKSSSKEKTKKEFSPKVKEIADQMVALLIKHNPVYRPPDDISKFLYQVEQMIEKEKQNPDILLKTFEWAISDNEQRGDFKGWQGIVVTNKKGGKVTNPAQIFREAFSKIYSQMNSRPKRRFAPCSDDQKAIEQTEANAKRAL